MTSKELRFPLFFGSTVVLGCFIGMMGNTGAVLFSSLGVMVKPLVAEFGWSRGDISFGATCLTIGIIFGMLATGHLIDRFGSRRIVTISIILSIIVLITGPLYISTLPQFYLMIVLGAVLGAPTNTVGYVRVIACWFDKRRGLFIGITAAGMGVGFALVPWLTDLAVSKGGWKAGYYGLGLFLLLVVLPAVFLLVRDRPEDLGFSPDGRTGEDDERVDAFGTNDSLSLMDAAKTPTFCLLFVIIFSVAFALFGTLTHLVPMLTDRGINASTAALVASSLGIGMTAARLGVGYLLDRIFAPRLAMVVFGLAILGMLLLSYSPYLPLFFLAALFIGIGVGAETDLIAYMLSRYYGIRNFAKIFSFLFSSYMLGTGIGPYVFGRSFDNYGSYSMIFKVGIALLVLAIVLLTFLAPYDRYLKRN